MLVPLVSLVAFQASSLAVPWTLGTNRDCSLASDGHVVYSLTDKGYLQAIAAEDGQVLAQRQVGQAGGAVAATADQGVVALVDGKLMKFSDQLRTVWTSESPVALVGLGSAISIGPDGTIAVKTVKGLQVFASSGKGGGIISSLGAGSGKSAPLFLDKDTVVYMSAAMAAVRVANPLSKVWSLLSGQNQLGASAILFEGSVYVPGDKTVYRLDAATGEQRWAARIDDHVFTPAAFPEAIVVPCYDALRGLDAATGRVIWKNKTRAYSRALAMGENRALLLAQKGTQMRGLLIDALTGETVAASGAVAGSQVMGEFPLVPAGEGRAVGCYNGRIFCFSVQ